MKDELLKPAINFFKEHEKILFKNNEKYNNYIEICYHFIDKYTPIIIYDLDIDNSSILINIDHYDSLISPGLLGDAKKDICPTTGEKIYLVNLYINNHFKNCNEFEIGGTLLSLLETLAHELRHVHQYNLDMYKYENNIYSTQEEYYNIYDDLKSEEDARIYARYFIHKFYSSILNEIQFLYPNYGKLDLANYMQRKCNNIKSLKWNEDLL